MLKTSRYSTEGTNFVLGITRREISLLFMSPSLPCHSYLHAVLGFIMDMCRVVTLPICSVMVDASSYTFKYYKGGIYCNSACSHTNLNQAMLVVGYGTDSSNGEDYWILKNRY